MTGLHPTPAVTLDGLPLPGSTAGGVPTDRVALDGVEVTWGRTAPLGEQPEPATARLSLFDPTRAWAVTRPLIGAPVQLSWTADPGTGPVTGTYFRGRVAAVDLRPHAVTTPAGRIVRGTLVQLSCTSILTDLANRIPAEAWPAETLGARADRVRAAALDILGDVIVRAVWREPEVAPVAAADQVSIYEHLVALYDSCGADRMTYEPHTNRVLYLVRPDYDTRRDAGVLWWDITTGARPSQGVYIRPSAMTPAGGTDPVVPMWLDAAAVGYDEGLARTAGSGITRVQVTHPDLADAYNDRTTTAAVPGVVDAAAGVRTLRQDSLVTWRAWADLAAADLLEVATEEGAGWRPGPVRFLSRPAGGFETIDHVWWLLGGTEITRPVFLQRSWMTPHGVRPIFHVIGGTIAWRSGGWEVDCELGPVSLPTRQHPVTWEEIDNGTAAYQVRWDDTGPRRLHDTVTFEDLAYVGRGLGATATGPDTGWDFYA